jgi:chromosome segregation ATPase
VKAAKLQSEVTDMRERLELQIFQVQELKSTVNQLEVEKAAIKENLDEQLEYVVALEQRLATMQEEVATMKAVGEKVNKKLEEKATLVNIHEEREAMQRTEVERARGSLVEQEARVEDLKVEQEARVEELKVEQEVRVEELKLKQEARVEELQQRIRMLESSKAEADHRCKEVTLNYLKGALYETGKKEVMLKEEIKIVKENLDNAMQENAAMEGRLAATESQLTELRRRGAHWRASWR